MRIAARAGLPKRLVHLPVEGVEACFVPVLRLKSGHQLVPLLFLVGADRNILSRGSARSVAQIEVCLFRRNALQPLHLLQKVFRYADFGGVLLRLRYDRSRADDGFRCDADFIGVRWGIWIVLIALEESALSALIGLARQIKRVFFSDKTPQSF